MTDGKDVVPAGALGATGTSGEPGDQSEPAGHQQIPVAADAVASKPVGIRDIVISAVIGVVVMAALGWLAWDLAGRPDYDKWYELARTVIFAFAAVGALPAGLIAFRRQRTLEIQRQDARKVYELSIDVENRARSAEVQRRAELDATTRRAATADLLKRYTEAAEQLGHAKAAVRLAGVYAIAHLADDWTEPRHRQTCIDVLCAYVRSATKRPSEPDDAEVGRTVIRTIAQHLRPQADEQPGPWADLQFDFTGANFPSGCWDFGRIKLVGGAMTYRGARFAPRSEMNFIGATIGPNAALNFEDARFTPGSSLALAGAEFEPGGVINLDRASLAGRSVIAFGGSTFAAGSRASFDGVTLHPRSRILFGGAVLNTASEVTFDGSKFLGGLVSIKGASITGRMTHDGQPFRGTDDTGSPIIEPM